MRHKANKFIYNELGELTEVIITMRKPKKQNRIRRTLYFASAIKWESCLQLKLNKK